MYAADMVDMLEITGHKLDSYCVVCFDEIDMFLNVWWWLVYFECGQNILLLYFILLYFSVFYYVLCVLLSWNMSMLEPKMNWVENINKSAVLRNIWQK